MNHIFTSTSYLLIFIKRRPHSGLERFTGWENWLPTDQQRVNRITDEAREGPKSLQLQQHINFPKDIITLIRYVITSLTYT